MEQGTHRDKNVSVNSTCTDFFGIKLAIDNGIIMEVSVLCYLCNKKINLVLTGNIEKRNDFFSKVVKSAIFHLVIQ